MLDKNLFKLNGMRAILAALGLFALLQAAIVVAQSLFLSNAVVAYFDGGRFEEALTPTLLFLAAFIALNVLRFAQETLLDSKSRVITSDLRTQLMKRTFDPRSLIARERGSGAIASVATDKIDDVQTYLRIIPPKTIGMVGISLPLLVCEFVIDWPSGVILCVMFPVIMFFMVILGKQARARSERQYESYTLLSNRFMDTIRGMRTIQAHGATLREEAEVRSKSEALRKATVRTLSTATLSSAVLDLCATFGVAAVAMMLAFRLMDGSIALGTALTALVIAPEYFNPIRSFANDYHASLDGKNALSEILGLVDSDEKTGSLESAHSGTCNLGEADRSPIEAEPPVLQFENVSYTYGNTSLGVHDMTFTFKGPLKVGVIGKSGSGKSTLANLIAGFMPPSEGITKVDGELRDLCSDEWKRRVRYIPQNPYIFRGTLAENIAFYHPEASSEAVTAAAVSVGLGPLLEELPDGTETIVGDGGRGLSGGEAHRVALARVLLDDHAQVLVFDEPTAHLDIETELDLREPMLEAMRGKLVFLATHRMHWIDDMEVILSLEDGCIVQREGFDEQ